MRHVFVLFVIVASVLGCKSTHNAPRTMTALNERSDTVFIVAFGSCNKQYMPNPFWDDIMAQHPDLWIWGGDNIYASEDFSLGKLKRGYAKQRKNKMYKELVSKIPVVGTWDDHDYGLNDGGEEFSFREKSHQLFLDFMNVPRDDQRRGQQGVYTSHEYETSKGKVKVLVLDTRYFRSPLEKDPDPDRRYKKNMAEDATILGPAQWQWLQEELNTSDADFNLLVTSVQFLSMEHGFESWGNFPKEIERLNQLILDSGAKGVMVLSGDRHISEFSRTSLAGMTYPLIDFTSSGLTHSYSDFKGEPNQLRVGEVVSQTSFGLIELNLETKEAHFKIMGENGMVYQELKQRY